LWLVVVLAVSLPVAVLLAAGTGSALVDQYAGTESCKPCHPEQYGHFLESSHRKYVRPATTDTVGGDFVTNNILKAGDYDNTMTTRDGQFFVRTVGPDGKYREYRCESVIGFTYKQRYSTTLPDGRRYALPVQWNVHEKKWVDYHGLAREKPGTGHFWCDPETSLGLACAGCHFTGVDLLPVKGSHIPRVVAAEQTIGCEACHGPCKQHVDQPKDPAAVLSLRTLSAQRQVDLCGQCHSRGRDPQAGTEYPFLFRPGDRLAAKYALVEPLIGKTTDAFWADGQALQHHQQYTDYIASAHYLRAGMTCTACHDPHRRAQPAMVKVAGNDLCLDCHTDFKGDDPLKNHTRHDPKKEGSACIPCHMPRIMKNETPMQTPTHTFWPPNPLKTIAWNTPNACSICHDGTHKDAKQKTPQQVLEELVKWKNAPQPVILKQAK
jgi:predicted CXXCH cytochrome family protein